MAINYAEKYGSKVAELFSHASFVKMHTNGKLDFTGNKTLKIYMVNTVPVGKYTRSGSSRYGEVTDVQDTVMEYTMTQDLAFTGVVDKGDAKDQTIDNKVGAFLNAQNKQQIVPNADKYALRKFANFGHVEPLAAAPAKDTVCGMFAKAREWFTDHLVPEDGRIAYVASDVYTMIAQSDEFIKLEKLGEKSVSRGEGGMLVGLHIIEIRKSYLPAGCYFLCMAKNATCMPYKIEKVNTHIDPPGISGVLIEGRYYFDAFVFGEKADAVYAAVDTSKALTMSIGGTNSATTLTCSGAALIKYTLDGSDPRFSDSAQVYSAAVNVGAGNTIRAVGFPAQNYETDPGKFTSAVADKTW